MSLYSSAILYAYAQLGLRAGAPLEDIQNVQTRAAAYKFFTKPRLVYVRRFTDFFTAWHKFGKLDTPYAEVRKSYHGYAKDFHPDKNKGDKASEERLKEINAAYALIEAVHKEAKDYFKQSEKARSIIEQKAWQATENEAPETVEVSGEKPGAESSARPPPRPPGEPKSSARKYLAASVPRSIRVARLGYLPLHTVIGNIVLRAGNGDTQIFDVFMLPEEQFMRAKSYLAVPSMGALHLQYGKFAPPYILKDIQEITVPAGDSDPEAYAIRHFAQKFGLTDGGK